MLSVGPTAVCPTRFRPLLCRLARVILKKLQKAFEQEDRIAGCGER